MIKTTAVAAVIDEGRLRDRTIQMSYTHALVGTVKVAKLFAENGEDLFFSTHFSRLYPRLPIQAPPVRTNGTIMPHRSHGALRASSLCSNSTSGRLASTDGAPLRRTNASRQTERTCCMVAEASPLWCASPTAWGIIIYGAWGRRLSQCLHMQQSFCL